MKRSILPIVLAAIGLMLLVGCFYLPIIPHPESSDGSNTIFDVVGKQDSKRLLRVNIATCAQVLAFDPYPMMASLDGKSLLYSSPGMSGYWVAPLCFMVEPQSESFYIRLNFDDAGMLRSYVVDHGDGVLRNGDAKITGGVHFRQPFQATWPPPIETAATRAAP